MAVPPLCFPRPWRSICKWNAAQWPGAAGVWAQDLRPDVPGCIKELASCNPVVPEDPKAPVRWTMKMEVEQVNERECEVLKETWASTPGMDSVLKYLQRNMDAF